MKQDATYKIMNGARWVVT